MWNAITRPGFELVSPCPFPTVITITPQAPPLVIICYSLTFFNSTSYFKIFKKSLSANMLYRSKFFFFGIHIHTLWICRCKWGCRILRLHLCRGIRTLLPPSANVLIWNQTIWWWGFALEYTFIVIAPRSTLTWGW